MNPRTLIPVDESETAKHTIQAIISHQKRLPKEVLLLHVVDVYSAQRLVPDIQKSMVYEAAEKSGRRILERLAKPFQDAGFDVQLQLEIGLPGETILKVVEEQDIGLVVIGRHPGGGGLRDVMFGSVASKVIRGVKCQVLLF